jgi:hypothetical protein
MATVQGGRPGFLGIAAGGFVVLDSMLEGISAIVLYGPPLFLVAKSMGVHEVHFALVIIPATRLNRYPQSLLESLVFAATLVAFQTMLFARRRE